MGYSRDTSGSVLVGPMSESDTNIYNELLGSSDLNIGHYVLSLQNSNGSIQKFGFNEAASYGDLKRIAVYFTGWDNPVEENLGNKRETPLNVMWGPCILNFDPLDGTIATKTVTNLFFVTDGKYLSKYDVNSNIPQKHGYTFDGWGLSSDPTKIVFKPGSSITWDKLPYGSVSSSQTDPEAISTLDNIIGSGTLSLTANYSLSQYKLIFPSNVTYDVTYSKALPSITVTSTKTGYIFSGYYDESVSGGKKYYDENLKPVLETFTETKNVNLTPRYVPIKYNIAFNCTTGTGSMDTIQNVEYDSQVTLPKNTFTKVGYTFTNWKTGGYTFSDGFTVSNLTVKNGDTVTLNAIWSPNVYTITYNITGSTNEDEISDIGSNIVEKVVFDSTYVLQDAGIGKVWKQGYKFIGWKNVDTNQMLVAKANIVWKFSSNQTYVPVFKVSNGVMTLVNQNNKLVWCKCLMYTLVSTGPSVWKRTDVYVANEKGVYVLDN